MDLSSIRAIFGPSLLFLLLNLVIAIAVVSSRHRSHRSAAAAAANGGDHQNLPLARASASNVLERVRSLGLFRFRPEDFPPALDVSAQEPRDVQPIVHQHHQVRRIRSESDSQKAAELEEASAAAKMKKSASAKAEVEVEVEIRRRPAVRREAAVQDQEVDAKADDFINRFRNQLKLQRLDSLLRYKEMLTNSK